MLRRSEPPISDSSAVTLSTSKHLKLASFARSCHPSSTTEHLSTFVPKWSTHPELTSFSFSTNTQPVYRPGALTAFAKLPFLRPSCLYVGGRNSPYWTSRERGRAEKLRNTGTGVGSGGGVAEGKVAVVVVDGGHFCVFETPVQVAQVVGQWLEKQLAKWCQEEEKDAGERASVDPQNKAKNKLEMLQWLRNHYGKTTRGRKEEKQYYTARKVLGLPNTKKIHNAGPLFSC